MAKTAEHFALDVQISASSWFWPLSTEEEEVLKLAKKSLSLEWEALRGSNYDVFRHHVSSPILELFSMPESLPSKRSWKMGVNLAVPMQTMFKAQSRAKLQNPRHTQLVRKYDGGSPKLTGVIDVGHSDKDRKRS